MTDTDTIRLRDIPVLNVDTITLGEMMAAEVESGQSFDKLLTAGNATRRVLALWLQERRSKSSAERRTWSDLCDLRPFAG